MLGAWSGSPGDIVPPQQAKMSGWESGGAFRPAMRRQALPLAGGGGEAGREDRERGAGADTLGKILWALARVLPTLGCHLQTPSALSALLDSPYMSLAVDMCVYRKINHSCGDFPCKLPGEFL